MNEQVPMNDQVVRVKLDHGPVGEQIRAIKPIRTGEVICVKLDHGPIGELIRAVKPINAGEVIFYLSGEIVNVPTKYTIQLDEHRHVVTASGLWKSMNHACEPNVRIDVKTREMIAIYDLAPGQELTFNYNTTEWHMASPFACGCGALSCTRTIRGFKHLTPAQREVLRPYLSPFIASRFHCAC